MATVFITCNSHKKVLLDQLFTTVAPLHPYLCERHEIQIDNAHSLKYLSLLSVGDDQPQIFLQINGEFVPKRFVRCIGIAKEIVGCERTHGAIQRQPSNANWHPQQQDEYVEVDRLHHLCRNGLEN